MASPSPAKLTGAGIEGSTPLTSKSLRGLNKPKCIKCGNVARSRCPYQSCKSCCAKAQNPCHIHVLKGSSSLPDKPPSSSSPLSDQQSHDASHSGNSHRLRHLSSNFAQFSTLQTPFRPRKPLTKKDAQVINEWRFMKLKEFKDGKALAESGAFDRYMQNVSLLEEVFSVHSGSGDQYPENDYFHLDSSTDEENTENLINDLRLKLRTDVIRSESFRKRIKDIVDEGLRKLGKDLTNGSDDLNDTAGMETPDKKMKISSCQSDRESGLSELVEKMEKARSKEDFKECREKACHVLKWKSEETSEPYLRENWFSTVRVDQESICKIDAEFSGLDEIEDL